MSGPQDELEIRFTDVLTTASTVANYLGVNEITAGHMLQAIALLKEEIRMEDLGRGVSPLLQRASQRQVSVAEAVRELVQRWYAQLRSDVYAVLNEQQIGQLRDELTALVQPGPAPAP